MQCILSPLEVIISIFLASGFCMSLALHGIGSDFWRCLALVLALYGIGSWHWLWLNFDDDNVVIFAAYVLKKMVINI